MRRCCGCSCFGPRSELKSSELHSDTEDLNVRPSQNSPGGFRSCPPLRVSLSVDERTPCVHHLEVHCKRNSSGCIEQTVDSSEQGTVRRISRFVACFGNGPWDWSSVNWYRTWCLQPVPCTIESLQRTSYRPAVSHGALPLDKHYDGQVQRLLSSVTNWDFNIFTLDTMTHGRPLFFLSLHLFQYHGLIELFHLDIVKLMHLFSQIENGYHSSNPYHNAVHAADVTQAMNCFILEPKLAKSLTPLERLSALLSAISHDLDHPGINQGFLIATSNPLVPLYRSKSVLENHHWRNLLCLLRVTRVFDHFDSDMWSILEWQTETQILATDISCQQEILSRFQHHLNDRTFDVDNDDGHRNLALQIALKCADICNPCRPWELSQRWGRMVCDEFFQQGDFERGLQLPVTKTCDRHLNTVVQVQLGFISFIVRPLFVEWQRFVSSSLGLQLLDYLEENNRKWQKLAAEQTAKGETEEHTGGQRRANEKKKTLSPEVVDDEMESENLKRPLVSVDDSCHTSQSVNDESPPENRTFCSQTVTLDSADLTPSVCDGRYGGQRRGSLPSTETVNLAVTMPRRNSAPVITFGRSTTNAFKRIMLSALVEHSSSCSTPNSFVSDKSGHFFPNSTACAADHRRKSDVPFPTGGAAFCLPLFGGRSALSKASSLPFNCDRLPLCAALMCGSKKVPSWNAVSPMETGLACVMLEGRPRNWRSNSHAPVPRTCFIGQRLAGRRFSSPVVGTDSELAPLLSSALDTPVLASLQLNAESSHCNQPVDV